MSSAGMSSTGVMRVGPARPACRARELPGGRRCTHERLPGPLELRPQAAVEPLRDGDFAARPGPAIGPPGQGECPTVPGDGTVAGHGAPVPEREHGLRGETLGPRSPGGRRIDRGHREPLVVAGEVAGQEGVRVTDGGDAGQTQLRHELTAVSTCSCSTNSATSTSTHGRPSCWSRSSPSATSGPRSWSPPTYPSANGARCSPMGGSPPRSWTG